MVTLAHLCGPCIDFLYIITFFPDAIFIIALFYLIGSKLFTDTSLRCTALHCTVLCCAALKEICDVRFLSCSVL